MTIIANVLPSAASGFDCTLLKPAYLETKHCDRRCDNFVARILSVADSLRAVVVLMDFMPEIAQA